MLNNNQEQLRDLLSLCSEITKVYGKHLSHLSIDELEFWDYFIDSIEGLHASLNDPNKCPRCSATDWDYANIGFSNVVTCLHCGNLYYRRFLNNEEGI